MSSLSDELGAILSDHGGVVTAAEAKAAGVSNERLRSLVASGHLERVKHGVYASVEDFTDKMYIAQLQRPKMIYSHETALYLNDLTDRDPISYTVTVPTGYNSKAIIRENISVFSVKEELHQLGAVKMQTMFGHSVMAYGPERTICDCIRSRNKMDIAIVTDAVKRYAARSDKNLNTLMQMAEAFRITKPLRTYLEVLL